MVKKAFNPTEYDAPAHVQPLALREREAAQALGVCPRTLGDLRRAGVIPFVQLSERVIVYPIDSIRERLRQLAVEQADAAPSENAE